MLTDKQCKNASCPEVWRHGAKLAKSLAVHRQGLWA